MRGSGAAGARRQRVRRFLGFMVRMPAEHASASAAAERALVNIWSFWRFATMAAYAPSYPAHRRVRRTAWVVPALVGIQAVEGAWVHRRFLRRDRIRQTIAIDTVVMAATLAVSGMDTRPESTVTDANWPYQLATSTSALAGMFLPLPYAAAIALGLDVVYSGVKTVVGDPPGKRALRLSMAYLGNVLMARTLAAVTLTLAAEVDEYRATAADLGDRLGRLAESHRVSEVAVDRSLEVLTELQSPVSTPTLAAMRAAAAYEALRLRSILDDEADPGAFTQALWALAGASAARGMSVELLTRELPGEPEADVADVLCDGIGAALEVLAESTGTQRAVVRLRARSGRLICTVRSRRPVRAATCVTPGRLADARGVIVGLGGSLSVPPARACNDPEWRFEVPVP